MGVVFMVLGSCKKDNNSSTVSLPTITTSSVSGITQTSASCGGNITSNGGGSVTVSGVCWSTIQNPTVSGSKTTDGTGTGSFTSSIMGLSAGTTYYVMAYATNSAGTAYGNQVTFTTSTSPSVPVLTTDAISNIGATTASCGGNISSAGGGSVTARGVCWSTSSNPTTSDSKTSNGTGIGSFPSSITGLTANTTYYVRAYATNSIGTGYGSQMVLKTYTGSVADYDGNVYGTVTIGSQIWMAVNLKAKHYRNGTAIPYSTSSTTTGSYCYYSTVDTAKYGFLYNYYAVSSIDSIAPTGWHVATNADYTTLVTNLGGASAAGAALKEAGTTDWMYPNTGATNSSGFTALPGGYYGGSDITEEGNFWSSTTGGSGAYYLYLYYGSAASQQNSSLETLYLSIRCVKN